MKDPSRPTESRGPRATRRLALGVAGVALVSLAGGLWLFRVPLVTGAVRSYLSQADVDAAFAVQDAGLWGARLERVRLGPADAPDATAAVADVRLDWGLLGPRIAMVRLHSPRLRVRIDERGVSLGSLDVLRPDSRGAPMERLPDLGMDIRDGLVTFVTPAGDLPMQVSARGRIAHDFSAHAFIPAAALDKNGAYLRETGFRLDADTRSGVLVARLKGGIDAARLAGLSIDTLEISGSASVPRKLRQAHLSFTAAGGTASFGAFNVASPAISLAGAPTPQDRWRLQIMGKAQAAVAAGWKAVAPDVSVTTLSDFRNAAGAWRFHANELGDGKRTAFEPSASGDLTLDAAARDGAVLSARGQIALPDMQMTAQGRAETLAAIPALGGTPLGPIMGSGRAAMERALTRFSLSTRVRLDWRGKAGRIIVDGPLSIDARDGGGHLLASPTETSVPMLQVAAPSGGLEAHARAELKGGGLPPLRVTLSRLVTTPDSAEATGEMSLPDWRAADGRIDVPKAAFKLRSAKGVGQLSIDGDVTLAGRTEAATLEDAHAPLRIDARWGDGLAVKLRDGCAPVSFAGLSIPGHKLEAGAVSLCGLDGGVLFGADRGGGRTGGFLVDRVRLPGIDDGAHRVQFAADRIEGRFLGDATASHLEITAAAPVYQVDYSATRRMTFTGDAITARTEPDGTMSGAISGGRLDDPTFPTTLDAMHAHWATAAEHGRTVIRFSQGAAHVTDKPAAPDPGQKEWKPRFNPLDVHDVRAVLDAGKIDAEGAILLADGARPLATFTARHNLKSGEGRADIRNPGLMFSKALDLFQISERARGVVDTVRGPVGLDLQVTWDRSRVASRGHVRPDNISMAAVAIGPVTGLSGDIEFDDLFAMTTPPGQRLTIRQLNPGVIVNDGVISFQMLGPERIRIEDARWPFAAGKLSVDPQIVVLGKDSFEMTLSLRDVDVQTLLSQLDFKDLTATGHIEGQFPLVFDGSGGRIVKGELHGDGKGGTISYTGTAGQALSGAGQIAFDALKSFAYDSIVLELGGDLDGDIVTDIRFSGENMQPVGGVVPKGALPIPGVNKIKVAGWPFKFTVSVRAPFRRLVKSSGDVQDARSLVKEAIGKPEIDPQTPPPK